MQPKSFRTRLNKLTRTTMLPRKSRLEEPRYNYCNHHSQSRLNNISKYGIQIKFLDPMRYSS